VGQLRLRQLALVQVLMTPAATRFVSPLTLAVAAGSRVWTNIFDEASHAPLAHIQLAEMADYVVIAPATANSIAKFAHGLGEDIVSLTLLATRAPVILAPAMHETMWTNPIVQENVACLKARGYDVIEPEVGLQPEGTVAGGRMAAIGTIIARLIEIDRRHSVEVKTNAAV
jgi:phosphopantothenoylcysteine decarboxylase/phosphopantothenate--cysteine ligase